MVSEMKKKINVSNLIINLFFVVFSLAFIMPFIYVISISLSNEAHLSQYGYQLLPKEIDFSAYRYIFYNPKQLLDAYRVTIFISFFGTLLSVCVMAMVAYPLSRQSFAYKRIIIFGIFFTMLFGGGLIPNYIWNTQYLGLSNNVWVYILPGLANAWHIIIMRMFFQGLPVSLVDSGKIDGANEFKILVKIILPLSKPVLAVVALLTLLQKWNDWYTTLIYIREQELYTLQFLLQRILREAEFIKELSREILAINMDNSRSVPTESIRFAMVIVAAGPMLVVFPFFQKYFARGLTIGAVKG